MSSFSINDTRWLVWRDLSLLRSVLKYHLHISQSAQQENLIYYLFHAKWTKIHQHLKRNIQCHKAFILFGWVLDPIVLPRAPEAISAYVGPRGWGFKCLTQEHTAIAEAGGRTTDLRVGSTGSEHAYTNSATAALKSHVTLFRILQRPKIRKHWGLTQSWVYALKHTQKTPKYTCAVIKRRKRKKYCESSKRNPNLMILT